MSLISALDPSPRLIIRAPYVTIGLVAAHVAVFVLMVSLGEAAALDILRGFSVIPARMFEGFVLPDGLRTVSPLLSLITYQFLHEGWAPLILGMLFLWQFGDLIEDALGHSRYFLFVLMCGAMGGMVHGLADTTDMSSLIGASGAVSGVLGGYLMLYPRARLPGRVFGAVSLPAFVWIVMFFVLNLLWVAFLSPAALNTALWVPVGGAFTGAFAVFYLRNPRIGLWHRTPR